MWLHIVYVVLCRDRIIRRTGRVATEERPDGDFRELSVYPTEADMRQVVSLRKHITSGGLVLYKYRHFITYRQKLVN